MLTTIAALVILLGLMVSLARDIRGRSAETLTRDLLGRLERLVGQHPDMQVRLANVPALIRKDQPLTDEVLQQAAMENNQAFVSAWLNSPYSSLIKNLPLSRFDGRTLRDAWGTPIVFMPAGAPNIRIAPQNRYFFMSAGPDRRFTTLLDNLYSYERPAGDGDKTLH